MKVVIQPRLKITLEIDGQDYVVTKPTLGQQIALEERFATMSASGKADSRMVREHLIDCGLPETVANNLDADQLMAVQDALKPSKKN